MLIAPLLISVPRAGVEKNLPSQRLVGDSGLVVTSGAAAIAHRNLIITLAARHKLPAIYWVRLC
jgi:hypothetical protein